MIDTDSGRCTSTHDPHTPGMFSEVGGIALGGKGRAKAFEALSLREEHPERGAANRAVQLVHTLRQRENGKLLFCAAALSLLRLCVHLSRNHVQSCSVDVYGYCFPSLVLFLSLANYMYPCEVKDNYCVVRRYRSSLPLTFSSRIPCFLFLSSCAGS